MSNTNSTAYPPYVYFVRFGKFGPIKIGKTDRDPKIRLAILQSGSPVKLYLLAVINNPDEEYCEKALHCRFAHLNLLGEWFDPARELTDFIADHAEPWDPGSSSAEIPDDRFYLEDFGYLDDEAIHWDGIVGGTLRHRRRSRIKASKKAGERTDRLQHIRVAYLRHVEGIPIRKLASRYRVSVRTIQYWVSAALAYDDSEAETLRRMIDR
jgi:DNA-binding transcriptional regulator YiaG